jgi:hypothetical protein
VHSDPIDPHTAEGGLVEAFEVVLDLGIPNRLGRLVDVHHDGPLEVRTPPGSARWRGSGAATTTSFFPGASPAGRSVST